MNQSTKHILMVRPAAFGFNETTAKDNAFQDVEAKKNTNYSEYAHENALAEFNQMVDKLKAEGVDVLVAFDTPEPKKPDAIFPNNWFTTHHNGYVITYPLLGQNRRWERRRGIIELIGEVFQIENEMDLSYYEEEGIYLEGTGSMILDKENMLCYVAMAERSHTEPLQRFKEITGYEIVAFNTKGPGKKPIYHTNVMLSVATHFVVACLECIPDANERAFVKNTLLNSGKKLIEITLEQVGSFCGNVLEVVNNKDELILVMSERAYKAFTAEQITLIEETDKILHTNIDTIETLGGGGTRCMMAEIYLKEKKELEPTIDLDTSVLE